MILLLGFMGSGKSAVGRELAQRLGWPFADLDERIAAAEGCSIPEIFERQGEEAFRRAEQRELRGVLASFPASSVVALGGGTFVQPGNAELIEQAGALTVWLDAPLELLRERCLPEGGTRPLAADPERFAALYHQRLPFYARARLRVNAAAPLDNVVEQVLAGCNT